MSLRRPVLATALLGPLLLAAPLVAQPAQPPAGGETGGAAPAGGLTPREEQVLKRIQELKSSAWRSFGACRYDWASWRLSGGGVRVTLTECGTPPVRSGVAVHCDTLKVARRSGENSWEEWRLPLSIQESKDLGGEDRMVAALCANLATPAEATAKPAGAKPAAKPAGEKPAAKPAEAKPSAKPSTPAAPQTQ